LQAKIKKNRKNCESKIKLVLFVDIFSAINQELVFVGKGEQSAFFIAEHGTYAKT